MSKLKVNPFRYGNPVPPDRFIGRKDVVRTLFSRIYNGESTAVVGESHIGKSSILRYAAHEQAHSEWLGEARTHYTFVEIDCHLLPQGYQPTDFWKQVLDRVESAFPQPVIQTQLEVVRRSDFGSFMLKLLFEMLGRHNLRVVLLIDEFDVLLHHPNFNTAEFFGALRSLAVQTNGLALVSSSRLSVSEMNRRSYKINPLGSPFFNNLIEIRLLPLRPAEMDQLIDQTLDGSGVSFTPKERAYIARLSGRHPFLIQIGCAALFDAISQDMSAPKRRVEIEQMVQYRAADHFEDVWRYLDTNAHRTMLLLACAEMPSIADAGDLGRLEQYDLFLRWLSSYGLVEITQDKHCVAWDGKHWRISAASFTQWIVDNRKWKELEGFGGKIYSPEDRTEIEKLIELLNAHRQRLHLLQLQEAKKGIGADPAITTEIKEIEDKIADIDRQLQNLQS